jgi:hypothetical protein
MYRSDWRDKLGLGQGAKEYHTAYECPAFMYDLDGKPIPCTVRHGSWGQLLVVESDKMIGGMSGSPIVDIAGNAIGMVCLGSETTGGSNNPLLVNNLPGWLLP